MMVEKRNFTEDHTFVLFFFYLIHNKTGKNFLLLEDHSVLISENTNIPPCATLFGNSSVPDFRFGYYNLSVPLLLTYYWCPPEGSDPQLQNQKCFIDPLGKFSLLPTEMTEPWEWYTPNIFPALTTGVKLLFLLSLVMESSIFIATNHHRQSREKFRNGRTITETLVERFGKYNLR